MKFWQHLRWKIVAANMLVATLVLLALLLSASAYLNLALAENDSTAQVAAESQDGASPANGSSDERPSGINAATLETFSKSLPFIFIIALFAGLAVSLLLTQVIMLPYMEWARASRRIASGRYAERLAVKGDGELSNLAVSFNSMAESLDEVQQRRVALVGYLSHELRTPLSGISGYIEGMMDGVFPDTQATLALMYGEVRRMRRLVSDLQTLSRVQSGQVALRMGTFELPPFVHKATVKLQPQFITCGIDVVVEQPKKAMVVFADPDRVDQILLNLLANALANTPEGGTVTVEIDQDGDLARVDITDTGYGIAPEELPHIFERYYRADSTADHTYSGSGIGLSISRHLAWAMGGDLVAESDGPGKGSKFSMLLRISKSRAAPG